MIIIRNINGVQPVVATNRRSIINDLWIDGSMCTLSESMNIAEMKAFDSGTILALDAIIFVL